MQNPQLSIYIIGAGAIGKALAIFLQMTQRKVILIRGSVDEEPGQVVSLSLVNQAGTRLQQSIEITTLSQLDSLHGVVLVATKTFSNATIAQKLQGKKGQFAIVILQNGLNIEAPFLAFDEVYRCVLFSTSQVLADQSISFKAVAPSPVGAIQNKATQAADIVAQMHTEHFPFQVADNIQSIAWEKTILNCAFNSICPLLETDNGIFYRHPKVFQLAQQVLAECVELAQAMGVVLDRSRLEQKLLQISERAEGQLISTYEDLRRKRPTEIESLNLEMARMAESIQRPDLVRLTASLGNLIAIKSELQHS